MKEISSKQNRTLLDTRRVRDGKDPELFFVEGKRLFHDLLDSELVIEKVFVTERYLVENALPERVSDVTSLCSEPAFRSICKTKNPQGIGATVRRPEPIPLDTFLDENNARSLVLLESVSSPGNLGSVLRVAEAGGTDAVILSGQATDPFGADAVRASMGSVFRIPVIQSPTSKEAFDTCRDHGFGIYASAGNAPFSMEAIDRKNKALLCFGNEAHGLSEVTIGNADVSFSIPMKGRVESLNLAVAVGIVLLCQAGLTLRLRFFLIVVRLFSA